MHKRLALILLSLIIFLAGCDYSKKENQTGFFYNLFVKPMDSLLHLNVDEVFEYLIDLNEKVGPHYPSMYQDLIKDHRKTEIDYINGAVARLGKENHIPAPVNEFVTNLIHSKESQLNAQ